jgi:HEAT repeat protein
MLENSEVYKARWEAAKALGSIGDVRSIPTLVKALEDPESDVAWLAAKALKKMGKAAWSELFHTLVKRGPESVQLQHGAHHILSKQSDDKFDDLLEILRKSLVSFSSPESISLAAFNISERMKEQDEHIQQANVEIKSMSFSDDTILTQHKTL